MDQVMKMFARALEAKLESNVAIDDMQFTPVSDVVEALLVQYSRLGMCWKSPCKQNFLWTAFVDLEKAFSKVPRRY
jgi:hypothetical protein